MLRELITAIVFHWIVIGVIYVLLVIFVVQVQDQFFWFDWLDLRRHRCCCLFLAIVLVKVLVVFLTCIIIVVPLIIIILVVIVRIFILLFLFLPLIHLLKATFNNCLGKHCRAAKKFLCYIGKFEGFVLIVGWFGYTYGKPDQLFENFLLAEEWDKLVVSLNASDADSEELEVE